MALDPVQWYRGSSHVDLGYTELLLVPAATTGST